MSFVSLVTHQLQIFQLAKMNGKTLSLDDRQEIKSVIENVKYISKGDKKTKEETEDLGIMDMFKGRYLKTTLIMLLNWVGIFQIDFNKYQPA